MAEIILFFHSQKVQMLMSLLQECCNIYSFRSMKISVLASRPDILIGSMYLGPLQKNLFNLILGIISRSPAKMC